jgi:hypothetical protein
MDRPNDDRANFEPSNPGLDPDEAIARYLSQESEGSDDPEAEPDELDEEPEPEAEREHHPPFNPHPGPVLHRPVFGRKGL